MNSTRNPAATILIPEQDRFKLSEPGKKVFAFPVFPYGDCTPPSDDEGTGALYLFDAESPPPPGAMNLKPV